ncbi:MAG: peptide MFS transporter [Thermoanaerobaculia bacterium]|nr:peptide MFS transporter [Thermoanaerobaculia bacterium]
MSEGTALESTLPSSGKEWFGHPEGLATLFFTEMWERFSYYGMRALLTLFMTAPVSMGGFGWSAAKAGPIYGLYTALVYLTALPGGFIADRFIGQRKAVLFGGIIITAGHISLMFHGLSAFYLGLFLIIIGTGLLKPNISALVGGLYQEGDARRDAGFSLFYMGINLGAFFSPIVCGWLAQHDSFKMLLTSMGMDPVNSWHWGFGAAAVGMSLGVIQYLLGGSKGGTAFRWLAIALLLGSIVTIYLVSSHYGEDFNSVDNAVVETVVPAAAAVPVADAVDDVEPVAVDEAEEGGPMLTLVKVTGGALILVPFVYFGILFAQKGWTTIERKRLYAIPVFFVAAALFWSAFEQAGSTLTLFADRFTRNVFLGFEFPSTWFQSANAIFIVLLAPVFAWLWVKLDKTGREPSSPAKFAIGLFLLGLGFAVLSFGAMASGPEGALVSPMWLVTVYLLHTLGELCLSPVGLSTMTKLAPKKVAGQMMGIWFLASSVGNFIGGMIAGYFESFPLPMLFGAIFFMTLVATVAMLVLVKPVRGLMSGVH